MCISNLYGIQNNDVVDQEEEDTVQNQYDTEQEVLEPHVERRRINDEREKDMRLKEMNELAKDINFAPPKKTRKRSLDTAEEY